MTERKRNSRRQNVPSAGSSGSGMSNRSPWGQSLPTATTYTTTAVQYTPTSRYRDRDSSPNLPAQPMLLPSVHRQRPQSASTSRYNPSPLGYNAVQPPPVQNQASTSTSSGNPRRGTWSGNGYSGGGNSYQRDRELPTLPVSPVVSPTRATDESRVRNPLLSPSSRSRSDLDNGNMILWRIGEKSVPPPEELGIADSDSKYPSSRPHSTLIPYAFNPLHEVDGGDFDELDDEKILKYTGFNWRGVISLGGMLSLISAILTLFIFYPIFSHFRTNTVRTEITGNIRINATGQAPDLPNMPLLIDPDTPDSVKTRTGFDTQEYVLVFSDEFETPGRTFWPGDDPFWEAVDLWYWPTGDLEWYDPRQVTTRDGALIITMENILNHGLEYRSGMLQSWNKFCFTSGYIEVSLSLPGENDDAQGYWPGAWTMGNLGRPGYGATTDGMWPYSYDSCDVGTFPNQTNQDHTAPAAALHTDAGRDKYNFELSWLTGQRLSSCTCPGQEHPGPVRNGKFVGRGAPEIDILEAQKNKLGDGGKVSQSVQMAPFNADYQANFAALTINDPTITAENSFNGSAVQQAISCLTTIPPNVFNGTGGQYSTFGFEYWADENNRDNGFITWQAGNQMTFTMTAAAMTGDQAAQISNRLIPEEPMSIVLNLAISESFQNIDFTTLTFPAELRVDYVRVYQRKDQINIGCDGKDRPTTQYIQDHLLAYSNPNLTDWTMTNFPRPANGLFNGAC